MNEPRTVGEYRAELDNLRAMRLENAKIQKELESTLVLLQAGYGQLDQQVDDLERINKAMEAEVALLERK